MKERFPSGGRLRDQQDDTPSSGLRRRDFLKMLASVAGGAALGEGYLRTPDLETWLKERSERMRFEDMSRMSPFEREERIDREVKVVGDFIRSREGRRVLDAGTDDELMNLLLSLPQLLRDHIRGTKYDIATSAWPSVVVSLKFNGDTPRTKAFTSDIAALKDFMIAGSGFGNGVYVSDRMLLTNLHVLKEGLVQRSKRSEFPDSATSMIDRIVTDYAKDYLDITFVRMPQDHGNAKTVMSLTERSDDEVNGSFVVVAGIKPDSSSDPNGTKLYPSMALKMTPRLTQFLARYSPPGFGVADHPGFYDDSFLYVAPPGESLERPWPSVTGSRLLDSLDGIQSTDDNILLHGMSGSPVLMDGRLAGLNHRASTVEYNGICMDLGFFHGPDEIRKAEKLGMIYDVDRSRVPVALSDQPLNPRRERFSRDYDAPGSHRFNSTKRQVRKPPDQ